MEHKGRDNEAFENEHIDSPFKSNIQNVAIKEITGKGENKLPNIDDTIEGNPRGTWGNGLEFLMSCISLSIGLGNIWRFPFVAYENGGGAFLIPYVIVLILIGVPMYFMEMVLGQFSSRNNVKLWALSPVLKGVGWGQVLGVASVHTYYPSIIGMTVFYFINSFAFRLPWSYCWPEWDNCYPSVGGGDVYPNLTGSAELYFKKEVLNELPNIDNGIGLPDWRLALCLLATWVFIFLIVMKGIKSSGKASYFLALFPYIVMIIMLIRAVTLPGAYNGIIFFVAPDWSQLNDLKVWYAAVTQVIFSLSLFGGAITTFSSFNSFHRNVCRDAVIVTVLDTLTSLLAGFTIFGILGNLAYQMNIDDISDVIKGGGTGIAFITYPDAIAKFENFPQVFSVMFFFMLFVLGLGSSVATHGTISTVFVDKFKGLNYGMVAGTGAVIGFLIGLTYVTPGGQYILTLVDYYGGPFIKLGIGIVEIVGITWIYGLESYCDDLIFMLKRKVSLFWRWCWGVLAPLIMIAVFFYGVISTQSLTYGGVVYPSIAYVGGYCLLAIGVGQVPLWAIIHMVRNKKGTYKQTVVDAFKSDPSWGPKLRTNNEAWKEYKKEMQMIEIQNKNKLKHVWNSLNGSYSKK